MAILNFISVVILGGCVLLWVDAFLSVRRARRIEQLSRRIKE